MLDRILEIFRGSETLLDEAWGEAEQMLVTCQQMYQLSTQAILQEDSQSVRSQVGDMDVKINEAQRSVRKKVFHHIAVSRTSDVVHGLELAAIVIDLERIGDYTKNIGELFELVDGPIELAEFADAVRSVDELVTRMFSLTEQAIAQRSAVKGKAAMDLYPRVSRLCDRKTRKLVSQGTDGSIPSSHVGVVLLVRYLKRVAAHLKNVCSALVNPFHQIGYRDGLT